LAIALENARLLGGDIRVASELGVGTTVTARLPLDGPPDWVEGREHGAVEPLPEGDGRVTAPDDAEAHRSRKE